VFVKTIEQIGARALKEHILKNWMTHDAMWFLHCLQACGIEEANRLNKAAIRSLASIELRRARELFGLDKDSIESFEGLKEVINAAFSVSRGDFMRFTYIFPEKNVLRWELAGRDCFAYQGMERLGVIDRYECGVLFRVLCWIESAGVKYTMAADTNCCLMHTKGECTGEVRFSFP
jgi:hypothetical protein